MIDSWVSPLLLLAAGFVAGVLNVVAGGGSFLTLPVLIFLGLPPTVANATNRVGVLLQNGSAVWGFHRYRVLDWRYLVWAALPATVGAVGGTWLALLVSDEAFKNILAVLMILVTLWTLRSPVREQAAALYPSVSSPSLLHALGFFVVGIYAGFVQAGVGFFILAVTTMVGLDLVRGNAVKVLIVLATAMISLLIFAWEGKVDWLLGLILGAGTILGALLGVRLTVLKGHRWVRGVVTVTVILFAIKLLLF